MISILSGLLIPFPNNFTQFALSSTESPGHIAFQSDRSGNDEIYVMDANGANVVQLTHHPGFDGAPAWSPDGAKIAFQSNRTGNMHIYVLSLADSSINNLTGQATAEHVDAAWSPDGRKIAFASNRDGNYNIYVMNAQDGSGVDNLTEQTSGDNHNPVWSPDGSKIAFQTTRHRNSEIYVMDADGSNQRNLTNHLQNDWHPAWSPDGAKIVFISDRDGKYEIYLMNAHDGSGQTNLSNRPDSYEWRPSFSPDGTKIIFSTDRDRNPDGSKNDEIYVMNARDGSEQTNLTNHPASDQYAVWVRSSLLHPTVTPQPTTPVPVTPQPTTPVPVTPQPTTPVPVTPQPTTPVPVTPQPTTPVPVTPSPITPTPLPTTAIPESPDFATLVLRDAWDMNEFSDISSYLNASGQRNWLSNIKVQDGVFSAVSTEPNTSLFTLLMPGYSPETMYLGRDGALNPIPSAVYQCLFFAMKVESGPVQPGNPDQFQVYWYANARLEGSPHGLAFGLIHPEEEFANPGVQPVNNWKLYRVSLANPEYPVSGFTPWNAQDLWQGLMIRPINKGQTPFAVDWARLTPCTPNIHTVTWNPDANVNAIWLQPVNTGRAIRVAPFTDKYPVIGINGRSGSYDLDVQGLPPGEYHVGLGTLTSPPTNWNQVSPIVINQTPIVTVTKPSFISGEDYATQTGNSWDFADPEDVLRVESPVVPGAVSWSFKDNMLEVISPSGPLPAGIDTQIYLNTPQPVNATEYRYLTFRMYTEWFTRDGVRIPWANGPHGMVARWIWTIPSLTGQPGYECHMVGEDIPFDIGWRTYTVDLYDVVGGAVEEMSPVGHPHCPARLPSWRTLPGLIKQFRFDPNENISEMADQITGGGPFYQLIDWIKLTKVDQVARGTPFLIEITLNKPLDQIQSLEYFYTTNRNQPVQHRAIEVVNVAQKSASKFTVFLPLVTRGSSGGSSDNSGSDKRPKGTRDAVFQWDTRNVAPGEYHICVTANDGVNQATYCSEAPVQVK